MQYASNVAQSTTVAPELLDLAERLGFMVLDEIFDCWTSSKTTNDFHTIWADWHEPDLRSFICRDRNHPSVIAWSFGNEIVDQQESATGGTVASQCTTGFTLRTRHVQPRLL
jgi:beta-galactosidase